MQKNKTNSMIKFIVTAILTIMLVFGFALPTSVIMSNIQRYDSISVKADGTNEIEINKIPKSANLGDPITLPKGNATTIVIKDPKNKVVSPTDSGTNYTFVAEYSGDYSVEYKSQNGASTGEIYIKVKGEKPSFNFDVTDKQLLPSIIATGATVNFTKPEILDENGDVIEDATATLTLKKAGSDETITYQEVEGKNYYSYTFAEEGVYSVVYSYKGTGYNYIDDKHTIEVVNGYEDNIDLTFDLDGSLPTSMVQGVEVELPKAKGKDKNNSNASVQVNTTITVEYLESNGQYTSIPVTDYKFVPTYAGTYRIKYKVTDYYGNSFEKVYDPIENVRDSQAPTIKIVENYNIEEDGNVSEATINNMVDASTTIPSVIGLHDGKYNGTISIPAIFATDNVAGFKDLTLKRSIKSGTSTIANLDDTTIEEYKDNKINNAVSYTFKEEGTYTIVYRAYDKTNSTTDSLYSFTVVVKDTIEDKIAPTVQVKEFVSNEDGVLIDTAEPNQKIRIAKPTVIDYVKPDDASNKDTNDTRPTLEVYAQIGDGDETKLELDEDEKYYEYTIPADATQDLKIIYKATDCYGNTGNVSDINGLIKTLSIINTSETSVPVIANVKTDLGTDLPQYQEINLNGATNITVTDADDNDVQLKVVVTKEGEVVEEINLTTMLTKQPTGGSVREVLNAKFTPNSAGSYVVNFVAYDHAGNYSVQSAKFSVKSQSTPIISVNDYPTEMELGKAYIPQAYVLLDGKVDEGAKITMQIEGDINKVGTVKVTYSAIGSNDIETEEKTITIYVKDSVKPTISIDSEVPEYVKLGDKDEGGLYPEISLPGFTAVDDGSKVNPSTYKIVVKNKNDVEIAKADGAEGIKFRPTGDGKYKVTYSVSDYAGNVITETYTINVGDVQKPVITIKNEPVTTAKLKNGSYSLVIDASSENIKITDVVNNSETVLENEDYLSVTVTNSSGTTIEPDEDSNYVFTLTEAGEYTITITAEDKAGNPQVKTYKLDLSAEDNGVNTTTEVLGTILLVISILVLIGVVWYFVKPAPKKKRNKTNPNKKLENDDKK